MPVTLPPTIAEREAELAALQSAFDEYITSSRELEEELDAELAKMQEKLAESSAANAALSSQLENIAPQLSSLEKALAETRHKLEHEQRLRREAELAQDEAEARAREAEGALSGLKEECDAAHEELAFKESELEETRLELEVERERHRVEIEEIEHDLQLKKGADDDDDEEDEDDDDQADFGDDDGFLNKGDDEDNDYVKRLEDELELVTEQLIETEQRLTLSEEALVKEQAAKTENGHHDEELRKEHEQALAKVEQDKAAKAEEAQRLKEELELVQEELTLTQEELKAAEEDTKTFEGKLDKQRIDHREELTKIRKELESTQAELGAKLSNLVSFEKSSAEAAKEAETLREEIDNLNKALENAKKDHAAIEDELDQVHDRFDEVRQEAEKVGRESATEEVRTQLEAAHEKEVASFKSQLKEISETCSKLQQKVDESEMALAAARDAGNAAVAEAESETTKKLQDQLARAKDELAKKEQEAEDLQNALETRVAQAEKNVTRLEKELSSTKGKLAEAEASLIVTKREQALRQKASAPATRIVPKEKRERSELSTMSRSMRPVRRRRTRSSSPTPPTRMQLKIVEERKKKDELQKEFDVLKEQNRMGEARTKRLEENVKALQTQLFADGNAPTTTQMSRLSTLAGGKTKDNTFEQGSSDIEDIIKSGDVAKISEELRGLEKRSASQKEYNAQLLSKILDLQGNIQVCCRVRPMSLKEIQAGGKNVVESLSESELGCFDNRNNKWKSFAFDKVWGPDQTQQSIFQDVEPLALSVVDGYNACIFAYGQTGSGKTYTMEGIAKNNNYGISYRTIQKIIHLLNFRFQQQVAAAAVHGDMEGGDKFEYDMSLSMLEIYNDEVYDLLSDLASSSSTADERKRNARNTGEKATLDIRRGPKGKIEIPNLSKEPVKTIEDVMALLKKGNANRATASTDMNEHSSRSHMVLAVDVSSGIVGQPKNKGTLYLVDLAGSERVRKSKVQGDQLKEAGHINKSLSALGNVMEALDRKASHVPYRDSKLTYLLQDSLGGNSRTMMVVTVCPIDGAYDESVHALQFATRVRRIQIGAAQRNVTSKNLEETVKSLTAEMKALSVAKEKSEHQLNSLRRDNTRIQERLQSISKQRSKTQSDSRTLDVLRKNNQEMANRWQKEKNMRESQAEDLEKAKTELRKTQSQMTKLSRERDSLTRKLEDKEAALANAAQELRRAKDASSAANLRARKAQIISSRAPTRPSVSNKSYKPSPSLSATKTPTPTKASSEPPSPEILEIRKQVLELLTKYDKAKVGRIDIIMEKFKGKESLLVEKMKQRYEGGGDAAAGGASTNLQRRSEMALQRHKERMQKRLEQQAKKK